MPHHPWKRRLGVASLVIANLALAGAAHLSWGFARTAGAAVTPKTAAPASEEERVIQAITKANPAVVSIVARQEVSQTQTVIVEGDGEVMVPLPEKRLEDVGRGTGFLVSADGMIVTNRHVARNRALRYDVLLSDGRSFPARVLDIDPVNDLALLKVDARGLPVSTLETDDRLRIGQTVIAIGNALGKYSNTVTRGILSGVDRSLEASDNAGGTEVLEDVLQTDAAINRGNSGGPLLNLDGRVIGVNVAIDRGGEGLSFAIPVSEVRKVLASYGRYGAIARPRLGVRYVMITPELRLERKLEKESGALIDPSEEGEDAVVPNGPAAKAGLRAGDIILEVNGKRVEGRSTLGRLVQGMEVGDSVALKLVRNGIELNVRATLDAHPPVAD